MKKFYPPLFSFTGLMATIGLVLVMNEAPPPKQRSLAKSPATFSVPPPPPKIQPKNTPKPRPQAQKAPPPPLPMLNSSLSGLSFGMEGLEDALAVQQGDLLQENNAVVMTTETVDLPPRATQQIAPEYPSRARKKGVEGYVTLSLLINEYGTIQDVLVVESYPEGIFDQSATTAIQDWRFVPGEYEGNPVPVRVTQTLRYSLG